MFRNLELYKVQGAKFPDLELLITGGTTMSWQKAASLAELDLKPVVFKDSPKQIAIFKIDGRVFAVDNRCPHEGYPLAEGTVDDGCLLTCNWHNWKFRLEDGECVLGGDHVRSYPIEQRDGDIWIDLTDPLPEEVQQSVLRGLETAFNEREFGRICREISRLHFNKLDPVLAVRAAIAWSADRVENGYSHAYASSADWLHLSKSYAENWERQLVCLAECVDHMAFDSLRWPVVPFANSTTTTFDLEQFVSAVESEDREAAESMVCHGLKNGLAWTDMEEAFATAALDHYSDFGHVAIYVFKTSQLIAAAGREVEPYLLPTLARRLCYTTREDLIPEFSPYGVILSQLNASPGTELAPLDADTVFPASTRQAVNWVAEHWPRSDPNTIYQGLLEALARNLLHFWTNYGIAIDIGVNQSVGWLHFTHGITFANAVRNICEKYPQLWRQGLLQMACFVGRNRSFLDDSVDLSHWQVDDHVTFLADAYENVLDHGLRDPIFSAHLIKTITAVEEESKLASTGCQSVLLASLNRFLNSPIKQKHTRRIARQSIDLIKRDFA